MMNIQEPQNGTKFSNPKAVITYQGIILAITGFLLIGIALIRNSIILFFPGIISNLMLLIFLGSIWKYNNTQIQITYEFPSKQVKAKGFLICKVMLLVKNTKKPFNAVITLKTGESLFPVNPISQAIKVQVETPTHVTFLLYVPKRGKEHVNGVTVSFAGIFGLYHMEVEDTTQTEIIILPEPQRVTLPWTMKQRILNDLISQITVQVRGRGDEFLSLKDFEFGDEIRHIHWKASAKYQKLIVKEFEEPKQLRFLIIIDNSLYMAGPKLEFALSAAVEIAGALRRTSHSYSILVHGDKPQTFIQPGHSMKALRSIELSLSTVKPSGVEFNFKSLRDYMQTHKLLDTTVILISDIEKPVNIIREGVIYLTPIVHYLFYLGLSTTGFGTLAISKYREKSYTRLEEIFYKRYFIEPILESRYWRKANEYTKIITGRKQHFHYIHSYETNVLLELHELLTRMSKFKGRGAIGSYLDSGLFSKKKSITFEKLFTLKNRGKTYGTNLKKNET